MNNSQERYFNSVLTKEYLGYQYEIYLDAERECLSGEILGLTGWYDSDSLTHLKEQIERRIELEINYQYQAQLAEENNRLKAEIKEKTMKKLIVDYLGYKLEVVVEQCSPRCYPTITGTCNPLSFVKKDTYGSYQDIIVEFMKAVDKKDSKTNQ